MTVFFRKCAIIKERVMEITPKLMRVDIIYISLYCNKEDKIYCSIWHLFGFKYLKQNAHISPNNFPNRVKSSPCILGTPMKALSRVTWSRYVQSSPTRFSVGNISGRVSSRPWCQALAVSHVCPLTHNNHFLRKSRGPCYIFPDDINFWPIMGLPR